MQKFLLPALWQWTEGRNHCCDLIICQSGSRCFSSDQLLVRLKTLPNGREGAAPPPHALALWSASEITCFSAFPSSAAAMRADTRSAAAIKAESGTCAYRAVTPGTECPSSPAMVNSENPISAAVAAKV